MADHRQDEEQRFGEAVERKAHRKIEARGDPGKSMWFSLGMMGLVGWSVAMPTVAGIALGRWIDTRWPGDVSWTLTLLFAGIVVGCLTAWHWITRESRDV
jgi:ATP synthase protein I